MYGPRMDGVAPPGARFAYETAAHSLAEQLQRIDALDSKAGVLLAADGIIVGLVLVPTPAVPGAAVVLGGIAVLLSLFAALGTLANRRYVIAPEPSLVARLAGAPDDWIMWRLMGTVLQALDTNRVKIRKKARLLTFAQAALLAGLVIYGGYFVYAHLSGGA